jgi:PAS domain S-box-containing protein
MIFMIKDIFTLTNTNKLLDTIYNSIVITDGKLEGPDHPKILYVNKAFETITGYSSQEIIGKTPRVLQGERTERKVLDRLKDTLKKGEFFEGNTINYKKDGTPYFVEWNITPIKNNQGEIINYFCVQKDITESIRYKDFLKQRVEEEVNKRKDQELINQKQAKMAAMGEMIDAIAHQWKQPIGVIKLRVEMLGYDLEDGQDPLETYKAFQEKINAQIDHMENTLQEFRGFLRTDKELKCFYIKDVVQKVLLLTKDEFMKYKIEFSLDIDPNLYIYGYENEFKHVILNMLNNSRDAFEENNTQGRVITIKGFIENEDNILLVQDNAGGIEEQKLPKIFEPEFTTKSADKGSGIGLYMSKQILDKFHATIKAHNQSGGICFTIKWGNIHNL